MEKNKQFKRLLSVLSKYKKDRPKPERNLDQFRATEETILKRANYLGNIDNIAQKKMLFLGDSDLTSIAFSMFYKAGKITVLDVDQRLLNFVKHVSSENNYPIECFKYDLRNPLEKSRFKDYDICFFDPPYTPSAINTWLIRSLEACLGSGSNKKRKKPEILSSKLLILSYGYTDVGMERGLKIQQIITSLGLIIQEKHRDFNKYYGAKSIKSLSDLYIIQPTPQVNLRKLDTSRSQFYTGKKQK